MNTVTVRNGSSASYKMMPKDDPHYELIASLLDSYTDQDVEADELVKKVAVDLVEGSRRFFYESDYMWATNYDVDFDEAFNQAVSIADGMETM